MAIEKKTDIIPSKEELKKANDILTKILFILREQCPTLNIWRHTITPDLSHSKETYIGLTITKIQNRTDLQNVLNEFLPNLNIEMQEDDKTSTKVYLFFREPQIKALAALDSKEVQNITKVFDELSIQSATNYWSMWQSQYKNPPKTTETEEGVKTATYNPPACY